MKEITVKIKNKIAICPKRYLISANSDYKVKFEFDDEWNEEDIKTARILFSDKVCDIPFIKKPITLPKIPYCTEISIGVFTDQMASTFAALGCIISCADCSDANIYEFTQSQYDSLIALINEEKNKVAIKDVKFDDIYSSLRVEYSDGSYSLYSIFGPEYMLSDICTLDNLERILAPINKRLKALEEKLGAQ